MGIKKDHHVIVMVRCLVVLFVYVAAIVDIDNHNDQFTVIHSVQYAERTNTQAMNLGLFYAQK